MTVSTLQLITAYDEAGGVYYTITDDDQLTAINETTGATTKVTISYDLAQMVFRPSDGRLLGIIDGGGGNNFSFVVINPATGVIESQTLLT